MASQPNLIVKTLTYASTTSTLLGQLPPNAYITDIKVLVPTAGNAGGNDYIDIGTSSSANRYADDINVASTGSATVTATAYWGTVESTSAPTQVYGIYVPSGTTPTAGTFRVVISYAFNE